MVTTPEYKSHDYSLNILFMFEFPLSCYFIAYHNPLTQASHTDAFVLLVTVKQFQLNGKAA